MLINAFVETRSWMVSANTALPTQSVLELKKRCTAFAKFLIRNTAFSVLFVLAAGLLATTAQAGPITDPANDFRAFDPSNPNSFAGPKNPGLDVLSANVILDLNLQTLTFTSTMAGPISGLVDPNTGANLGSFSWGINHGYGSNNFADIGLPNVLFDAVLTLNPNGTGSYRGSAAPAGSVVASGNILTGVLPISFLGPPPQPAEESAEVRWSQWRLNRKNHQLNQRSHLVKLSACEVSVRLKPDAYFTPSDQQFVPPSPELPHLKMSRIPGGRSLSSGLSQSASKYFSQFFAQGRP
jgi:hypothetical protein